jgi:aspartyl-tRNA(Asn)/glutamyl-tRNA(Gln) amidotransferase subunit A
MASELTDLSARELLAGYRARDFTPVEVVDAVGRRIEELDPALGAFTTLCLDRAREEAQAPGDGPLAGVPFAAKDLFDSAGVRTTYGSRMFDSHVPKRDAAAIATLRAAGAILVGKTQTHEFAWGITSYNEAMGSARNPWATDRVSGGSSGGSAVALAARLVPLALGSDTGGSIRIPSAFCGVMGLKPTYGRLDARGVWPLAPSLDHVGPLARTPGDVALAFATLDGRDGAAAKADGLDGLTIVSCPQLHIVPLPADRARIQRQAIDTLAGLGARVDERPFPLAARVEGTFGVVQMCEAAQVHQAAGLYPARASEYGYDVRTLLERATAIDPSDYVAASADREALRAELGRLLEGGAVLATPVSATAPIRFDELAGSPQSFRDFRSAVLPYTTPQDLAGLPSCTVRAGFDDDGLPVAIQLTAAPWREGDVLRAARAFYEATPDLQARRPDVSGGPPLAS